ncbi:MAG: patatin-like phospholipase family protein [Candidatus Sericytochromatia bacterium]|nr:patatin-like phospholipase family protein [Candidatus Sericytochromatia bacterium]
MRVGLVMGSGGVVGASYLVGVLEALRRQTGWEPSRADTIIGTSAGAFIGALTCALPVSLMYRHCTGEVPPDLEPECSPALWQLAERLDSHNLGSWWQRYPLARHWPRLALTSPQACASLWRRDPDRSLIMGLTGLIGDGLFSNRPIAAIIREACAETWPHPGLRVTACDLDAGTRIVFGPEGSVPVHQAVAASTAVPGLFAPVDLQGRRYVDGGAWSASNLDLIATAELDLVLAIIPLAGATNLAHAGLAGRLSGWIDTVSRRHVDARLAAERLLVEATGTRVMVLTPAAADRAGSNVLDHMNLAKRPAVMAATCRATAERLVRDPAWAEVADQLRCEVQSRAPSHAA